MRYCQIRPDIYDELGITENPAIPDEVNFLTGHQIRMPLPSPLVFAVDYPVGGLPAHMLGDEIPVVSKYFVECLKARGVDNFEIFPAVLRNPETSQQWEGYYAFNVLGLVAAAELDQCSYDTLMEGGEDEGDAPALLGFDELVFGKDKVRGVRLFRLAQNPTMMFLIDKVVNALKKVAPPGGWGITLDEVPVV